MNTYQKLSLVLALGAGFSATANSSTTTLFDNLSSPISGEQGIPPGWIADAFTTGINVAGYNLGDITLKLSGSIDGNIQGIVLQLYSDTGLGVPGTTAIGHAFVDPLSVSSTQKDNIFTPNLLDSSLVLSANTTYWVKLDATAQGAANINWSYTSLGLGQWAYDTLGGTSDSAFHDNTGPFMMKVEVTSITGVPAPAEVPVPAAAWFMGTGMIGLISSWSRKKRG
jgi:hypothetical protein